MNNLFSHIFLKFSNFLYYIVIGLRCDFLDKSPLLILCSGLPCFNLSNLAFTVHLNRFISRQSRATKFCPFPLPLRFFILIARSCLFIFKKISPVFYDEKENMKIGIRREKAKANQTFEHFCPLSFWKP